MFINHEFSYDILVLVWDELTIGYCFIGLKSLEWYPIGTYMFLGCWCKAIRYIPRISGRPSGNIDPVISGYLRSGVSQYMSAKFPPHSLHPEYQETQAPKPNTREDKKSRPDQGKSSDPTIFFELTCYRCKEKEHVVKFCPTKKALIKTEPQSQQHLVMSHKKS